MEHEYNKLESNLDIMDIKTQYDRISHIIHRLDDIEIEYLTSEMIETRNYIWNSLKLYANYVYTICFTIFIIESDQRLIKRYNYSV